MPVIYKHFGNLDYFLFWWQQFDIEGAAPPEHALRRKLNSHASILKEFSITFREAIQMVINSLSLGTPSIVWISSLPNS